MASHSPMPQPGAELFQATRKRMKASTPNSSSCKLVTQTSNTKRSSLFVLACLLLETQRNRSFGIYLKPPITIPFGCHLVCQIFTVELKCPQDIGLCNGNNDLYELGVTVPNKPFPSVRILFCSSSHHSVIKGRAQNSLLPRFTNSPFLKNTLQVWSDFSSGTI